ncbi:MAG TPA: glycosyltransferase family 9 protein [Gammaproteobacteria bacterium]
MDDGAEEGGRTTASAGGRWQAVRRLLVIRADNIGDVVMAGPALRAVRETLPDVHVTLLASPTGAQAAPLLPWIDDVIVRRVLWQDLGRLPFEPRRERGLIARLAAGRFDGAVILTSFSQSPHPAAFVAWLAGIPLRAGASRERSGLLTDPVAFPPFECHQTARNLAVVAALGFRVRSSALEVRIPPEARSRAAALLRQRGIADGASYLLWNPWATAAARTWDPRHGSQAVRLVAAATGLSVVVTGSAREADGTAALAEAVGTAAVDLAGRTSVAELAALVRDARLVITNHTLAMHLADALGTPAVVTFSGTDLESQWAPRRSPHRLLRKPTACAPCYAFDCPFGHECLGFEPRDVADAALELLAASAPPRATPVEARRA